MKTNYRLIILMAIWLSQPVCSGASYTVTTTNDTGPGSLRAVITQANAVAGPHEISFGNSGHFAGGGTISLASPLPQITQDVTIVGWRNPGSAINAIAITGSPFAFAGGLSNSLQQLNIGGSVTCGQSASITGCVISGGGIHASGVLQVISSSVVASPSAGIWSSGNATLNGVTVSMCSGGGIHNEGTMAMANCEISGNSCATDGAGIYSSVLLQVAACQIIGNSTLNGRGGGFCNAGTAFFSQTTIRGNVAYSGFGGGVFHMGQQLSLAACLVANNIAQGQNGNSGGGGGAGVGGGLYSVSSTVIATNVTFSGNQALGGAGDAGLAGTSGGPNPGTGGKAGSAAGTCGPAGGSGGPGSAGGKFSGGGGGGNGGGGHGFTQTSCCHLACIIVPHKKGNYEVTWDCSCHSIYPRHLAHAWYTTDRADPTCGVFPSPSITSCPTILLVVLSRVDLLEPVAMVATLAEAVIRAAWVGHLEVTQPQRVVAVLAWAARFTWL